MGNLCCSSKKKYIIEFYKNTQASLEAQLECYVSDEYNCDANIYGNTIIEDCHIYTFKDIHKNINLKIKCKITENKMNYKMTIYEINEFY